MSKNQKNHKRAWGFTLIEVILVLALVTTLGALAAPQFTDVFDHSKDQADIAQMDQILAAFQMEQAPFYEGHMGKYDLLQDENVTYIRKNGEIVDTIINPVKARKTLQIFLNNVVKPGSDVYMEGAKCVKTEKTHVVKNGKQRSVFQAKLNDAKTALKIVCRADKNESSIELPLPGLNKPIEDKYSDGEMVNGTWMIIGDDDRLRADYVEDYLKKKDQKIKKKLDDELEKNKPYKYRASFKIETEMIEDEVKIPLQHNLSPDDKWITWLPWDASSVHKIMVIKTNLDELKGVTVKASLNGGAFTSVDGSGIELDLRNNSNGKEPVDYVDYQFSKPGEETMYLHYEVSLIKPGHNNTALYDFMDNNGIGRDLLKEVSYSDDDHPPTLIWSKDNKNPHVLYYAYTTSSPGYGHGGIGDQIIKRVKKPVMDFYTGFIFNAKKKVKKDEKEAVEYQKYDFLAFHYNEVTGKTELSYREYNGNSIRTIGESIKLDDFQYNHPYTMEVDVRKDKSVYLTLYDNATTLLNNTQLQMGNNTLRPAIGFYMNNGIKLENPGDAVTDDAGRIPLIHYDSDKNDGPRFVLLGMPEFSPYTQNPDSGSGTPGGGSGGTTTPEPNEPEDFICKKPEIKDYSGDPRVPYEASATTKGNSVQCKWVEGIENTEKPAADQGWGEGYSVSEGKSGWLWVREYKGDSFAPQEKWEKKPWVDIANLNIVQDTNDSNNSRGIARVEFESLPTGMYWKMRAGNKYVDSNEIEFDIGQGMSPISCESYIVWEDKNNNECQISKSLNESFRYSDFVQNQPVIPFAINAYFKMGNGNQYQLDLAPTNNQSYFYTVRACYYNKGNPKGLKLMKGQSTGRIEGLELGKSTEIVIDIIGPNGELYHEEWYRKPTGTKPIPLN